MQNLNPPQPTIIIQRDWANSNELLDVDIPNNLRIVSGSIQSSIADVTKEKFGIADSCNSRVQT